MSQITFVLMDAPFESARSTTAMRIMHRAVEKGHDINVFAYEGAVNLAFTRQKAHANSVHGNSVEEENHPLPKDWVAELLKTAKAKGVTVDWVNCGLCVDERGADEMVAGTRRGSPADLHQFSSNSSTTLVIPTR